MAQLTKHERRQKTLKRIADSLRGIQELEGSSTQKRRKIISHAQRGSKSTLTIGFDDEETLDESSLEDPYHISKDQRYPIDIGTLLASNENDPALEVCDVHTSFCKKFAYMHIVFLS